MKTIDSGPAAGSARATVREAVPVEDDPGQGECHEGELIRASLESPELFAAVFGRHGRRVLAYLSRRTVPAHAEDLLSEVFLVAFERRDGFRRWEADALPWLLGIATNVLRAHWRREQRSRSLAAKLASVGSGDGGEAELDELVRRLDAQADADRVRATLERLSPRDRDVVVLSVWEQLSHEQIARALDIPVGTVKSRFHRARRLLAAALDTHDPQGDPR